MVMAHDASKARLNIRVVTNGGRLCDVTVDGPQVIVEFVRVAQSKKRRVRCYSRWFAGDSCVCSRSTLEEATRPAEGLDTLRDLERLPKEW